MKKYDMTVKSLNLENENIGAVLVVCSSQTPSIPLFTIRIDIERQEDVNLLFYELLALKKAATLIQQIADDLAVTA
ncbi:TPA: hypothetical protein JLF52_004370 [Escherichia coli]|nr:hypothetical protein [Escherichia coli]HAV9217250.1 hypothetical protein [Escherichia coli]